MGVALALQSAIAVVMATASATMLAKGAIAWIAPSSDPPLLLMVQKRLSATAATEMLTIERGRGTGPIANHRFSQL